VHVSRQPHLRFYSLLLALLAVPLALLYCGQRGAAEAGTVQANDPLPFTSEYYLGPNERFGVGLTPGIRVQEDGIERLALITDYDIELLHIGWYANWGLAQQPLRPGGIKYAQMVLVRATEYPTNTLEITSTVTANPGDLWIVGNQPEAKYGQGNRTPGEYAQIYHDVYGMVKGLDPSARVAVGGVVEPTPLRLQWLDLVLEAYHDLYGHEMPVDVWNVHMQILQEKAGTPEDPTPWGAEIPAGLPHVDGMLYTIEDNANPELFGQLVTGFRQWMKAKGFQGKPLIVSEYGVLMPSDILTDGGTSRGDLMVMRFMRETFDFLVNAVDPDLGFAADDYRLVQQWLWYSLNDRPFDGQRLGFNGSLFSHLDPKQMTIFGAVFREYMHRLMGYPRSMLSGVWQHDPQG